jgi:hypothetical protein
VDLRRSAAASLGVLILCAVVVIAVRNRTTSSAAGSWGSSPEWSRRALVLLVVVGVALMWLVLLVRTYRKLGNASETSLLGGFGLLAVAAAVTAIVAVIAVYVAIDQGHRGSGSAATPCTPQNGCYVYGSAPGSGSAGDDRVRSGHEGVPRVWLGLSGAVAFGLFATAAFAVYRRRRRTAVADEEEAVRRVSAVLEQSLDDLRRERDARRAVIACYARMEAALSGEGLRRRPFEAPFEYLERLLAHVTSRPVQSLTELFEEAKFSRHVVHERMRRDAINALTNLQRELRA